MIIVVCLNPALDVTHHVDAVDWGGVNRPRAVRARPGGKGLNVARTLRTLGVEEDMAHTSLRIGLGRFTTEQEVDTAVDELVRHVNKLRAMSPLWEMAQEGIDIKSIEWAAH